MKKSRFWHIVFCLYGLLMLWLLFDRSGAIEGISYWEQVGMSINLTPLFTIRKYIRLLDSANTALVRVAVINLYGNVIMFIPLGFLLPKVSAKQRKLWKTLLTTALTVTLVEVLQLFSLRGSCDVDDLILNVLGAAVGYAFHKNFAEKRDVPDVPPKNSC